MMVADLLVIEVYVGVIIDGTEVKKDFFASPLGRNDDFPAIPDGVAEIFLLNTGEFAFRGEGDLNGKGIAFLVFPDFPFGE